MIFDDILCIFISFMHVLKNVGFEQSKFAVFQKVVKAANYLLSCSDVFFPRQMYIVGFYSFILHQSQFFKQHLPNGLLPWNRTEVTMVGIEKVKGSVISPFWKVMVRLLNFRLRILIFCRMHWFAVTNPEEMPECPFATENDDHRSRNAYCALLLLCDKTPSESVLLGSMCNKPSAMMAILS